MLLNKLKAVVAVVLVLSFIVTGATVLTLRTVAAQGVQPPAKDAPMKAAQEPVGVASAPKPAKQPGEILKSGIGAADEVKDEARRAFALMVLGSAQARSGDREAAAKTFSRAVDTANAITDADPAREQTRKAMTLMLLAQAQAEAGQVGGALRAALLIDTKGDNYKGLALGAIAFAQVKAGDVKGAFATVETIPDEGKPMAWRQLAEQLASTGKIKEALGVVNNQGLQDEFKVHALSRIAVERHRQGNQKDAQELMAWARLAANSINDDNPNPNTSRKNHALRQVALAWVACDDESTAEKIAEELKGSESREFVLAEIAARKARNGKVKDASRILETIKDEVLKSNVHREIALAEARAGDFKAARRIIDAMSYEKSDALLDLAAIRMKAGAIEVAARMFQEAVQGLAEPDTLWSEEGPMRRTPKDIHRIVSVWSEAADEKGALAWAESQRSVFVRAVALAAVADGMTNRERRKK